jgi:5-methyltetrahydropteroyltriglutamate--homocysteine methyltransferase
VRELPLLPVTTVGSWPRPPELLRAQRAVAAGRLDRAELEPLEDAAVLAVLRAQEEAGVDIVTDGEQRRDNFYSFVAVKLSGVRMMSLAEMLDLVEDKAGFEEILRTLDVPAYSISNPTCVGPIARREPLAVRDLAFLRRHTDRPVKVTLPGPYLLTRSMFVQEVTRDVYPTKESLADDVVRVLRDELADLTQAGADFVQLDEPVLTELVFTQGRTRTFMCAALAARKDPAEELDGFDQVRTGVHVCRGNWSRKEETLLRGGYAPLKPYLERMRVRQLVLEYATERAGDLMPFHGKELGLGVVNPRTDAVETAAAVEATVRRALEMFPAERLFLNPDCGFGTFSRRPVNSAEGARGKLDAIVAAARALRAAVDSTDPRST